MRASISHESEAATRPGPRWDSLASAVLDGGALSPDQGLAVLRADDAEVLELLAAAYRVRRRWQGNRVHLNYLINAKSGRCGEDCAYCSQSGVSTADIPVYDLVVAEKLLEGARLAAERGARTYCTAISGLSPGRRDLDVICEVVPRIKAAYALKVCLSPGLLDEQQADRLRAAGVDRINHNLNTSERFYPRICTTHRYEERLGTLRAVRAAGMEICSGGIVGMGEDDADVVELALRLGELDVQAVPVNFLQPIRGTPLAGVRRLNPRYCLKVLVLFRLANPRAELRIAAGREMHLGSLQAMGLYAADSIFAGDYLTTPGQSPDDDYRMIEQMGFEVAAD